jgi:hypothetical protein
MGSGQDHIDREPEACSRAAPTAAPVGRSPADRSIILVSSAGC